MCNKSFSDSLEIAQQFNADDVDEKKILMQKHNQIQTD